MVKPQNRKANRQYKYSKKSLNGDLIRSVLGQLLFVLPIIFADLGPIMLTVFGVITLLFFIHGVRTILKKWTMFELDEKGITKQGIIKERINWNQLKSAKLHYFSTSRNHSKTGDILSGGSWMELTLATNKKKLKLDSAVDNFLQIVSEVEEKLVELNLALEPSTRANFRALKGETTAIDDDKDPRLKKPHAEKYRDLKI